MSYATSLPNGLRLPQQRVPTPPPAQRPTLESFEARASDDQLHTPVRSGARASPSSGAGPLPPSLSSVGQAIPQDAARVLFPEQVPPAPFETAGVSAYRPPGGVPDKGDYSDPPAFPGFQHYRLFKKSLRRWDELTDVKPWRRAEKVLRLFSWELQQKMEHIGESELRSTRYLDLILEVLDLEAGDHEQTEKKRVVREALFDHSRSRDETMPQYVHRRMQQFQQAESLGIHVPSEVRGAMLEEGAMLGEQGLQNLRTLTRGSTDFTVVKRALLDLDIPKDKLLKKGHSYAEVSDAYPVVASEVAKDGTDDPDAADDFDEEVCQMLDHADLSEEQAVEVFAILERQQHRRRTWKENKDLKKAMRKDRQHFDRLETPHPNPKGAGKGKSNLDRLKSVTRCSICQKKGHWHRECPDRDSASSSGKASASMSSFVFSGFGHGAFSSFFTEYDLAILHQLKNVISGSQSAETFLSLKSLPVGEALIDPGAGEDLIGLSTFDRLEKALAKNGWKAPRLSGEPPPANGVGGAAQALYYAMIPISLGGKLGFVKTKVLDCDIPHLLSVGLLDHVGSIIDLPRDRILFDDSSEVSACRRLDSGHRTLSILPSQAFSPGVIPPRMCEDLNLKPLDFQSAGQYKVRQVSFSLHSSEDLVSQIAARERFNRISPMSVNSRVSQQCSSDSCSVSSSSHCHGEGSGDPTLESSGSSDALRAGFRFDSTREATSQSEKDEMSIHRSSTSRLDSGTAGLCPSLISSTQGRQPIWSVGDLSEVPGSSELSVHCSNSQGQVQEEGDGSGASKSGTSTNPRGSADTIIDQRPHSRDCCNGHFSDQGHVRELTQSHAGSVGSIRSSFATAIPRPSSSMAGSGVPGHSAAFDSSSVSHGCNGSRRVAVDQVSCKSSVVPWTDCCDDAVRFESDRNFVVYYAPYRSGSDMHSLFPGERDRSKREYFSTTSSGVMIQCPNLKQATHVKCYAPDVARMLMDQDLVDETVFYLKGKIRKEVANAVQRLDPSSDNKKSSKVCEPHSSPWDGMCLKRIIEIIFGRCF